MEVTGSGSCKGTSGTTTVTVTIPTIWFADTDNDGLGDAENTRAACEKPAGYVSTAGDLCPADPAKTVPGTCGCGLPETDCISTDIDFSSVQQDFMLFPNPVTLQTLYFSESISGTVYDSKGSLVFSFTELESIDTGILENGLYLIYTKTGDTYKFLVSR